MFKDKLQNCFLNRFE